MTEVALKPADRAGYWPPLGVLAGVLVSSAVTLRLMSRLTWCALGDYSPGTLQAWGPHNSQHLIDPYTFSHILHGVAFFFLFNWGVLRRKPLWGLVLATALEAGWEIFENTPFTIDRYRLATAAVGYTGDTIANSLADIVSCMAGWWLAKRVGLLWSILVFLVFEIGCALWIKDNLTLNIIMFIHPIEAIKQWQSGM